MTMQLQRLLPLVGLTATALANSLPSAVESASLIHIPCKSPGDPRLCTLNWATNSGQPWDIMNPFTYWGKVSVYKPDCTSIVEKAFELGEPGYPVISLLPENYPKMTFFTERPKIQNWDVPAFVYKGRFGGYNYQTCMCDVGRVVAGIHTCHCTFMCDGFPGVSG